MKRILLSVLILAIQLCTIVYARFVPTSYFSWSPYATISEYSITMSIDGRPLTNKDIHHRYRIPSAGQNNHPIALIQEIIHQYELTHGKADKSKIFLKYKENGQEETHWIWID